MTRQEFLQLPDNEKDALVAKEVFGIKIIPYANEYPKDVWWCLDGRQITKRKYSTQIPCAWEVEEEIVKAELILGIAYFPEDKTWRFHAVPGITAMEERTAPLTICVAALIWKGIISE